MWLDVCRCLHATFDQAWIHFSDFRIYYQCDYFLFDLKSLIYFLRKISILLYEIWIFLLKPVFWKTTSLYVCTLNWIMIIFSERKYLFHINHFKISGLVMIDVERVKKSQCIYNSAYVIWIYSSRSLYSILSLFYSHSI